MSEEKSFRDILYDGVQDADPPLYDVIYDALSSHLDGELVINIIASYTITMRRTYFSCAMRPGSNVSSTETKQDEWTSSIYHRLCILVDDRTTADVKDVYLRIVHNEMKQPQTKQVKKGRKEITADPGIPGVLQIARPAVRAPLFCPLEY